MTRVKKKHSESPRISFVAAPAQQAFNIWAFVPPSTHKNVIFMAVGKYSVWYSVSIITCTKRNWKKLLTI